MFMRSYVGSDGRKSDYAFFCEIERDVSASDGPAKISAEQVLCKLEEATSFVKLAGTY